MKTLFLFTLFSLQTMAANIVCLGHTKDNSSFQIDINRSEKIEAGTYKFKSKLTIQNQVMFYAGTAMPLYDRNFKSIISYDYHITEKPYLSQKEIINPIYFQTITKLNTQS